MRVKSVDFYMQGKDYKAIIFSHGTIFVMETSPGKPARRIESGPEYEIARDMLGNLKVFEQCRP